MLGLKRRLMKKKLNNKNIIYSNPQVGISSLLQINKNFNHLYKEMIHLNNKFEQLTKKMQQLKQSLSNEGKDNNLLQKEKEKSQNFLE